MNHVDPLPDDDPIQRRDWVTRRAKALSLLTLDTASWCAGFLIASWARYEFGITPRQCALALGAAGVCAVIHAAFEQVRFTARGRHPVGSVGEARDLGGTVVLAAAVALAALLPMTERPIPASVPVLGAAVALLLMGAGRVTYRWRRDRDARPARSADRTLVYGVDAASERLARVLLGDPTSGYLPVGLLDDDPDKQGLRMAGLRVLGGRKQLVQAVRDTRAGTVIFSINGSDAALMRDIRSRTLQAGAAFKVLPPVRELLDRPVTVNAVRDLQLTDLLGRAQRVAELTVERNGTWPAGGCWSPAPAARSAPSCAARSHASRPAELVMLDRDESALHAVQLSLEGRALLDGRDLVARRHPRRRPASPQVFAERPARGRLPRRRPQAPARCCEMHPGEAVKTNVWGTQNVLEAAATSASSASSTSPPTRPPTRSACSATPSGSPSGSPRTPPTGRRRHLPQRALRQRARQPRLGAHRLPGPDRGRRPGHRHRPRRHPLLHDRRGGRAARDPGRRRRPRRRGAGARHGRAGAHRRRGPPAGRRRRPGRSRSSTPACAPARSCTRCCSAPTRPTAVRCTR